MSTKKFDIITLDLSFDKTRFVEPEDDDDTGVRLDCVFFRRAAISGTEEIDLNYQVLLHKQLDNLIVHARAAMRGA